MSPPRGWLARVLDEVFQHPASAGAASRRAPKAQARRAVLAAAGRRGLWFGVPLLRDGQQLSREAVDLAPLVRWLAVLCDHVELCGALLDEPGLPRTEQVSRRFRALTVALALLYGVDEDAALLASGAVPSRIDKALIALEREIVRRRYLQGNPILGLVLNHAFTAIDTRFVLDMVVQHYGSDPARGAAARAQSAARAERLAATAAIARLSEWREVVDADLVRQAAEWQVSSLGLPRADTGRLLEQVKNPADLSRLVTLVPPDARQRVFMQTVLVAHVDGRISPDERELMTSLAGALGISPVLERRIEQRVRAFVRAHRAQVNPLAHAAGFAAANPPMSVRVARMLFDNFDQLWNEIRETGDLAVLLARRARGQPLSDEEQRRMREQLLDVVKAVPSLAFVSLPGGLVLLSLLIKVLPFDLRPSSFRGAEFRAFARGDDDALAQEDLKRMEDEFLRS